MATFGVDVKLGGDLELLEGLRVNKNVLDVNGIIFGLKVVRLDGRPMDWATSAVRALACFLSLIFLGLGFIWIAFDPEKQGWHDKIAGTVVVRLPRGVSLV